MAESRRCPTYSHPAGPPRAAFVAAFLSLNMLGGSPASRFVINMFHFEQVFFLVAFVLALAHNSRKMWEVWRYASPIVRRKGFFANIKIKVLLFNETAIFARLLPVLHFAFCSSFTTQIPSVSSDFISQ